jgi:hypothetical protein
MDLATWLKTRLQRHPLKEPRDADRARYTAEVMTRVRRLASPSPEPVRRWLPWPGRVVLAFASVAAGIIVAVAVSQTVRMPGLASPAAVAVLAESPADDDQAWLEETLQLLDELEEELPEDTAPDDESWLEELEMLDEAELAAKS